MNESKDGEFPPVPLSLLTRLEESIPEKCPDVGTPEPMIWYYAGQRAVVRLLRAAYNEQNEVQ